MKEIIYNSFLSDSIKEYIRFKCSLGYSASTYDEALRRFDVFCMLFECQLIDRLTQLWGRSDTVTDLRTRRSYDSMFKHLIYAPYNRFQLTFTQLLLLEL